MKRLTDQGARALTLDVQTPTRTSGAIAVVQLSGEPALLDAALDRAGLPQLAIGQVRLCDLFGIDRGLAARWAESSIYLFPHGGAAVVRGLVAALQSAGFAARADHRDPAGLRTTYPEATSVLEACMLDALQRAASPLAIDLLLDQPRRWENQPAPDPADPRHRILNRLIDPPLVVAVGPSNIGKSSLLNALARRGVSLVADEPGTTRDHVGALLELGGLVVRYIDTPGVREGVGAIEAEAVELAAGMARQADLILSCGDGQSKPLPQPPGGPPALLTALRGDLGSPSWGADRVVSVLAGTGLTELVSTIRDRLVPPEAIADEGPWLFGLLADAPETAPPA